MSLFRDYLIFNAQPSSIKAGKVGYSLIDNSISNGPMFNFFGHDIIGIFTTNEDKLIVELDKEIDSYGNGLMLNYRSELPISTDGRIETSVGYFGAEFPIARIQLYEVPGGLNESADAISMNSLRTDQFSGATSFTTVQPLYDHTVKLADIVAYSDSDNLFRTLELPALGYTLDAGKNYCVAIAVTLTVLNEQYGIGTVTPMDDDVAFSPAHLKTSIRTAQMFLARENNIKVTITYKDNPVNIQFFDRYKLFGVSSSALDTDIDDSFFSYGRSHGEVILDLRGHIEKAGTYDSSLVGYNDRYPNGIVLWNSGISKSRLQITVVDA